MNNIYYVVEKKGCQPEMFETLREAQIFAAKWHANHIIERKRCVVEEAPETAYIVYEFEQDTEDGEVYLVNTYYTFKETIEENVEKDCPWLNVIVAVGEAETKEVIKFAKEKMRRGSCDKTIEY